MPSPHRNDGLARLGRSAAKRIDLDQREQKSRSQRPDTGSNVHNLAQMNILCMMASPHTVVLGEIDTAQNEEAPVT
jgi:hypothetical protein